MKILQVIQKQQLRGAEVFASQLANEWEAAGHEVMMVVLQPGQAILPYKGPLEVLHASMGSRLLDLRTWKKMSLLIEKFKPDIVLANAADTLKYAVMSKMVFGWKQPVVYRNASIMSRYLRGNLQRKFNRFLLARASHIISVSEGAGKDILAVSGRLPQQLSVIPVGIGVERGLREDKRQGTMRMVHVGGFSFEKNHQGLLRIFSAVLKKYPDASLKLVGDGPLFREVRDQIQASGLEESVEMTGAVSNALDHIREADLLVLPSIIEGLPAVILEAFWCGTPVVAYNVGGVSEVVKPGETGWLVNKDDEQGFLNTITEIFEIDRCDLKKITGNAKRLVEDSYNNKVLAGRFIDVFSKLISGEGHNG